LEFETLKKEQRAKGNWRAHIANYVKLKKQKKVNDPEQYCKSKGLNCEAFQLWLRYIEKEDKYVFYRSFATENLERAKRSIELLKNYMDRDTKLRMPLMRDAIVAYAAPFRKSKSRTFTTLNLKEIENFIPASLQKTHKKICDDRDTIVAHCDLGPRNPRAGLFGISIRMAGYYWEDYKALLPEFEKLILIVLEKLHQYNIQEGLTTTEATFQDFSNPPTGALEDPGPPSME